MMMSGPSLPSQPPPESTELTSDSSSALAAAMGWLRAELSGTESNLVKSLLLYESGVLNESREALNEAEAAYEEASRTEPEFREPLERLVALAERNRSPEALETCLERLADVSDSAEERARAAVELTVLVLARHSDSDRARELLERAVGANPSELAAWLLVHLVAFRTQDEPNRLRALRAMSQLVEDRFLRGILLIELGSCEVKAENLEGALASLNQAVEDSSPASFSALLELEKLGRAHQLEDVVVESLERQQAWLEVAQQHPDTADAVGVPQYRRDPRYLADVCLRLALAHVRSNDRVAAEALMSRASALLPDDPLVLCLKWWLAEQAGDPTKTIELLTQLAGRAEGCVRAALWQRVAQAELVRGRSEAAAQATEKGLEADPSSASLQVLKLDLAIGSIDPERLPAALEQLADRVSSPSSKARWLLAAAEAWIRLSGDLEAAERAVERARAHAPPSFDLARVERVLSSVTEKDGWYEKSLSALLEAPQEPEETSDLLLEFLRLQLVRRDLKGAEDTIQRLDAQKDRAWLAGVLAAVVLPVLSSQVSPNDQGAPSDSDPDAEVPSKAEAIATAYERLAALADDPETSRAFRLGAALELLAGGDRSRSLSCLRRLSQEIPSDPLLATACVALELAQGELLGAQNTLERAADAVDDPHLSAILALRGAWLAIRREDPTRLKKFLEQAASRVADSPQALQRWALRISAPNDTAARAAVLDSASPTHSQVRLGMERFSLEHFSGNPKEAKTTLSQLSLDEAGDLGTAGLLLRSLVAEGRSTNATLARLVDRVPAIEPMRIAVDYLARVRDDPNLSEPMARLELAAGWARHDPALLPQLEWLTTAAAAHQTSEELLAREALASQLEGETASLVDISARMLNWLTLGTSHGMLPTTTPAARFANAEMSPPGCDPRRRAIALSELAPMLGPAAIPALDVSIGFNHLAAGNRELAEECFRRAVAADPADLGAWEGIRLAAIQRHDKEDEAEACETLGDLMGSEVEASALLAEAANIWLDELGQVERGERALCRAVELNIQSTQPFVRWFRRLRDTKDSARLLELIDRRLTVAEEHDELVLLHWERARALRALGRRDEALAALATLAELDPNHVGGMALTGEIFIGMSRYQEAADHLARLAGLAQAPDKQRLMSGVAAVDLFDAKLNDPKSAYQVLKGLDRDGLATLPIRERLAKAAIRVKEWDVAVSILERLTRERETKESRLDAGHLALAIHRDKRNRTSDAEPILRQALRDDPTDAEAIEYILAAPSSIGWRAQLLGELYDNLRLHCLDDPLNGLWVDRLARVALAIDDVPMRQATLGILVGLGREGDDLLAELASLEERMAKVPSTAISDSALPDLADPQDNGSIAELFVNFMASFTEAFGPTLASLGANRKNRIDPRSGQAIRGEMAAWAGALGIGEFDLYQVGPSSQGVVAVPGDRPAVVIPTDYRSPMTAEMRQSVARELYALRRGTVLLRHRSVSDIAALVVACCRIGGQELPGPTYALTDEFVRLVQPTIPRRQRKSFAEHAAAIAEAGSDPKAWYAAAVCSLDRMASLAVGDVSHALAAISGQRGQMGTTSESQQRAVRLLRFILSPQYLALRQQMGLSAR